MSCIVCLGLASGVGALEIVFHFIFKSTVDSAVKFSWTMLLQKKHVRHSEIEQRGSGQEERALTGETVGDSAVVRRGEVGRGCGHNCKDR